MDLVVAAMVPVAAPWDQAEANPEHLTVVDQMVWAAAQEWVDQAHLQDLVAAEQAAQDHCLHLLHHQNN